MHKRLEGPIFLFFIFISVFGVITACSCSRMPEENSVNEQTLNDRDAWYTKYHVIAHSGGGIDGDIFTNSLEAWELSYERGVRIIDADLRFSSDGQVVLRHKWSDYMGEDYENDKKPMDHDSFMKGRIMGRYTPMDLQSMLDFMVSHEDVYVSCDAKCDIEGIYEQMLNKIREMDADDIQERIIVSSYDYEDISVIKDKFSFSNFSIRQYPRHKHDYSELAGYCVENKIPVVMIWRDFLDDEGLDILTDNGLTVWVAVIDDVNDIEGSRGISGVVSNSLSESDLEKIRNVSEQAE